jgi:hypothetical protein
MSERFDSFTKSVIFTLMLDAFCVFFFYILCILLLFNQLLLVIIVSIRNYQTLLSIITNILVFLRAFKSTVRSKKKFELAVTKNFSWQFVKISIITCQS